MKILINTATTFKGGGVQVANSFLQECKRFTEHEYIVILGISLSKSIKQDSFSSNFTFYTLDYRPASRVFNLKNRTGFFKEIEEKHQPDVVFTTSGPSYWKSKVPHLVGYNLPHYIYLDSPFFNMISTFQRLKWHFKGLIIKYFFKKDSDAFVTQTDDVRDRVKRLLKTEKVYTVTNTCNALYFKNYPILRKLPERGKNQEFRLLFLSAFYLHKNFKVIPDVIDVLIKRNISNVKFVLTIPEHHIKQYFNKEQERFIYNVGRVAMDECPALYDECDAVFLPTLLECFSASYPEAMATDRPIITSDLGFAHTVCGEAALYFDPMNATDIADKIISLQNNELLQKELIEKGRKRLGYFDSAEDRAKKYLQYCELLINESKA